MTPREGYLRGAFVVWDPGGYPSDETKKRTISFWFNPEGLQRRFQIEQGQSTSGTEGASAARPSGASEQGADASLGTVKESFAIVLRFDADDRPHRFEADGEDLGVLPEIAALEVLLQPAETETEQPSDGAEPAAGRRQRPTVLFVWGRKRLLPVKITGLDVNELLHNSWLHPTRAEVNVSLEVLGEAHARDNLAVQDALAFTATNRRNLAQMFHERASSQGTRTGST